MRKYQITLHSSGGEGGEGLRAAHVDENGEGKKERNFSVTIF